MINQRMLPPAERQSKRVQRWLESDRFIYRKQDESWVLVTMMRPYGRWYPMGERDKWLTEYCTLVRKRPNAVVSFAEWQGPNVYLLVDVDFKQPGSVPRDLYTEDDLEEVLQAYTTVVKEWIPKGDPSCVVLTKPPYVKDGHVKHGFHLHFQRINCPVANIQAIHRRVRTILPSHLEKALDDCTTKPWLMYGSRKSSTAGVYTAVWATDANGRKCTVQEWLDTDVRYFRDGERVPPKLKYLPIFLSARWCWNMDYHHMHLNCSQAVILPPRKLKPPIILEDVPEEVKTELRQLVPKLKDFRADSYKQWITVIQVIHNLLGEDGLDLAHSFSAKCSEKYNEADVDARYNGLTSTSHGIDIIRNMAKADAPKPREKRKRVLSKNVFATSKVF